MAEPRRAAETAPRFEGGRFLIVEARYYDAIGADLLAGATRAIEAAGATYDLVSVAGALEIPAGMHRPTGPGHHRVNRHGAPRQRRLHYARRQSR